MMNSSYQQTFYRLLDFFDKCISAPICDPDDMTELKIEFSINIAHILELYNERSDIESRLKTYFNDHYKAYKINYTRPDNLARRVVKEFVDQTPSHLVYKTDDSNQEQLCRVCCIN